MRIFLCAVCFFCFSIFSDPANAGGCVGSIGSVPAVAATTWAVPQPIIEKRIVQVPQTVMVEKTIQVAETVLVIQEIEVQACPAVCCCNCCQAGDVSIAREPGLLKRIAARNVRRRIARDWNQLESRWRRLDHLEGIPLARSNVYSLPGVGVSLGDGE